ncbi:5476_t:CDS:2 [Funneliformis mosseae]|uniref:5476_t:CDS:1 n=1 Tax=Funneliformis mosseae TaxID=27381 RepID=A0A9N9DVI7_FUNMO|nr:5476_t:CDS:2 [Funneliformis mosseae]
MAITGHQFVGDYYAYAKPNNNHKREALSGIVNRLNGLPLLPYPNTTNVNESDFSQFTSTSESDSDFDVENEF